MGLIPLLVFGCIIGAFAAPMNTLFGALLSHIDDVCKAAAADRAYRRARSKEIETVQMQMQLQMQALESVKAEKSYLRKAVKKAEDTKV